MNFETYELTQTQLRVLESNERVGNLCAVFRLQGKLDEAQLKEAIHNVVHRTKPFAYRFLRVGQHLSLQIFVSQGGFDGLRIVDAAEDVYSQIRDYSELDIRLDGGAPYLFVLLKGLDVSHLVFVCHPALIDRFSLKPLFAAISKAYNSDEPLFGSLFLPQDELLNAEKEILKSAKYNESLRFWMQIARDTSFEWKPTRTEGELHDNYFGASLSPELTNKLDRLSGELGVPLGRLLLFSFHIFLSRMTRNDTVLTSLCHRIRSGSPDQIGFNENKIALKSAFDDPKPLVASYFQLSNRLLSQTEYHSDLPAREVAKELARLETEFKRTTNVAFAEDPLPYTELALQGVTATLLPVFSHRLDVEDVSVYYDLKDTLNFHVLSRSTQESAGIRIAFDHYLALLENLETQLDKPISQARMFNPKQNEKALELANGGGLKCVPEDPLIQFTRIAREQPTLPAVRCGDRSLTYGELHESARRIGSRLSKHFGKNEQPLVGICLPRSERMIQAILGVLASGAGYVPLDPQMPAERLAFIAKDARLSCLIVDAESRHQVEKLVECALCPMDLLLDPLPPAAPDPMVTADLGRIAYVIYTSGTTGKPKGVVLERGNLAQLMASMEGVWERGPDARWLQFASITFDASVLEIFSPLTHGGELVIAKQESRADPEAVFRLLLDFRVTHACIPPALLTLLPRRPLPDLKVIYCGGEAIDEEAARFWSKAVDLFNCYGPTEASVMATLNVLGGYKASTHIGRPIRGYQTFVLQEDNQPSPLGGVGEICIGGPAVAREYLGRPELTAQKFIANPFGPGRLYRTGDLARFLPNGDLEFLGRCDFQVKIRGFRIELGEIEAAIAMHPAVNGAYVGVTTREGNKSLVAWYVSRTLSAEKLRETLSSRLPHYMVPSFLIQVDVLPLTINGKVERARLPDPTQLAELSETVSLDPLQSDVRTIWASVLKVAPATIHLSSNFFHTGGHSLLAAMVCNRLKQMDFAVRPKALFEFPVFADFCEHIRGLPREASSVQPLTAKGSRSARVESRLIGLIHSRATSFSDDNMYNVVTRILFSSEADPKTLRQAFQDMLESNPIFRASFREVDGHLVVETGSQPLSQVPIREMSEDKIPVRAEQMRLEALGIAKPPLWRAEVLRTPDGSTTLLFCIHHALFDGWSLNLMMEEIGLRYEALSNGRSYARERLTWFDHCDWSRDLPDTRLYSESISYWRKKLASINARCELPLDQSQKQPNSNSAKRIRLNPETVKRLKKFADDKGVTLPPLLFSLYLVWIWRISNQEEIVCGYPYAGRDVPGTEEIYGTLVTMGFLRALVQPHQKFSDMVAAVHRQMIEDREHLVAAPYDAEIANMDSLNVIFSLQSGIGLEGTLNGGIRYSAEELPSLTSKGDIAGVFYQCLDGAIEGRMEYDSSLIKTETMDGFARTFMALVESAAKNPEGRVSELSYQTSDELREFLDFATGLALDSRAKSIPEKFAEVVSQRGDKTAVRFGARHLSYLELDRWSDAIASSLVRTLPPSCKVGLAMQKSEAAIAALLGILKAGAGYVPLDPSYPIERLQFFAENSQLRFVIADRESRTALSQAGLGHLTYLEPIPISGAAPRNSNVLPKVSPDSLAYIIHTSGSTGRPKGVMIIHQTVVRMIEASQSAMDFHPESSSPLIGSLSFDTSVLEIFLPLLLGGTLCVVPENARKDPNELHRILKSTNVSHVILSPVMLQNLPHEPLPSLKLLGFGGDAIDEATADWWSRHTRLFSLYGPTEITVQSSVGQIFPGENPRIIGKPLPAYRMYLLNRLRQPVPKGAIGEICIGGGGLARGYLNREDLTMERFVIDPFGGSPYALMYLTGDLGRYLSDGTIEFFGRNDTQVKLRGFRIELGEIENRLSVFPGIQHVVCAAMGEGERKYLAAYYVAASDLNEDAMRKNLSRFLPEYMIPSYFVRLKELPASVNGKIDRKALPAVSGRVSKSPPREGAERMMADIWEEILGFRGIGRDDHFFHFGGNSLLAVRMQAEVRKRMGLELSISEIYASPTIEQLTAGKSQADIDLAIRDARQALELQGGQATALAQNPPRRVLLTGAGGFLGIFLLHELSRRREIDQVLCLIRSSQGREAGRDLLLKQAKAAGLEIDPRKFEVLPGDLAAPGLGWDESLRREVSDRADVILHCGAFVHHLHNYRMMKPANVDGTRELLKLALQIKRKPFAFVSTLTVASAIEGATEAAEAILPNRPMVNSGYILTKWVGEQLVAAAARKYGLPSLIARPGNITGSTATGYTNYSHNHFWLFNKGCVQLGKYPDVDARVELTPVDVLAKAIVELTLSLPKLTAGTTASTPLEPVVANLSNPRTLSLREFFLTLAKCGFRAEAAPVKDWQRHLDTIDETNGLSTIKGFYTGDLSGAQPTVAQAATLRALASVGAQLNVDYGSLLPLYLNYLHQAGFLTAVGLNQAE